MSGVEVDYLAVVLAALSTMVVGSVWYTPKVFGKTWIKLAKLDEKKMKEAGPYPIVVTLIVSLISAYVLAHIAYLSNQFFQNSFLEDSLMTAFWVWLGFVASRFITHDAFEIRRKKLTVINISHELVTFMVMGLIIGVMGF